jgi:hypothetical protein
MILYGKTPDWPVFDLHYSRRETCPYCGMLVTKYPCVMWRASSDIDYIFLHVDCALEWGGHLIGDAMSVKTNRRRQDEW